MRSFHLLNLPSIRDPSCRMTFYTDRVFSSSFLTTSRGLEEMLVQGQREEERPVLPQSRYSHLVSSEPALSQTRPDGGEATDRFPGAQGSLWQGESRVCSSG